MDTNLYIDIETGPCYESMGRNPFDPSKIKLGNLKDQDKIKAKLLDAERDFEKDAALHPEKGEVLAVGILVNDKEKLLVGNEIEILQATWSELNMQLMAERPVVGWHISDFDLPFLVRRSWFHGLAIPAHIYRYDGRWTWHSQVKDLMKMWACGIYGSFMSMDKAARFLEVGSKPEGMHGGMFAELWNSGDIDRKDMAIDYLRNDLDMLKGIAGRMLP